ncbi:MAG: hypothetical protein ACI91B_004700 [Planctomycetota bacterium]|jgi:hypothetical protein
MILCNHSFAMKTMLALLALSCPFALGLLHSRGFFKRRTTSGKPSHWDRYDEAHMELRRFEHPWAPI